jgi:hypothetical protein
VRQDESSSENECSLKVVSSRFSSAARLKHGKEKAAARLAHRKKPTSVLQHI